MPDERYSRNMEAFSAAELESIAKKKVCIIGCGGLGGYVSSALARFGVGGLTVVDGDIFSPTNLNRQQFATEKTLGQNKALASCEGLAQINSSIGVTAVPHMLREDNAAAILERHDLIIDCLDNAETRLLLGRTAEALQIPVIHGAVGGFYGQVATVFPQDGTFELLYAQWTGQRKGVEHRMGNPVFIVQAVAAIQCSEALKLLAGRGDILKKSLLFLDLLANTMELVQLD